MIDFGATGNFMTKKYIKTRRHLIQDKKQSYRLVSLDNILLRNNNR